MANQAVQVELVATFGQFQAQVQQAAESMKKMAAAMGGSLAPVGQAAKKVGEDADKGFGKFKEGISRSREQSMFFLQALGEFGPTGKTAQIALSGVGSMLLGGGVVGIGLAAAQVGVRLLTSAWEASAEKAKKAAEEAKKASDKIAESLEAAKKRIQALQFKLSETDESEQFRQTTLEPAKKAYKEQEDLVIAYGKKIAQARRDGNTNLFSALQVQLQVAKSKLAELRDVAQAYGREYDLMLGVKALGASDAASKAAAPEEEARRKRIEEARFAALTASRVAYVRGLREQRAAEEKYEAERAKTGQAALDARARRYEKEMALAVRDAQLLQATWVEVGATISGAMSDIGNIIGGAASSWMQYFGQLIQKAIQLAIAMSATGSPFGWLNAAAAGIAMISAVSSVPEFRAAGGPVSAGSPYIVGERGPELFVPSNSGGIVPNHSMGGVTVNINAVDAQGVRRLLLDNGPALAEAIGKAARDGRRFG